MNDGAVPPIVLANAPSYVLGNCCESVHPLRCGVISIPELSLVEEESKDISHLFVRGIDARAHLFASCSSIRQVWAAAVSQLYRAARRNPCSVMEARCAPSSRNSSSNLLKRSSRLNGSK